MEKKKFVGSSQAVAATVSEAVMCVSRLPYSDVCTNTLQVNSVQRSYNSQWRACTCVREWLNP